MATTTIFSCLLVGCLYWCIATAAPLSLVAPLTPEYSPPWARRHTADNNVAYERYVRRRPPKYYGDQEIFEVREIYYKPRPKLTMTTTPSARYIDDDLMDLIILCDFQPAPKECENLTQRRKQSTKMPTILKPTPARTTTSTSTSTTTTTTTTTTRRPTRPSYQSIPTLPPIPTTEIQTTTTTTTTTPPPPPTTTTETTTLTDYPLIPILNEIQDEEVEIEETTLSQPEDNVKTSIINEDQEEEDRHIINILPTETETVDNNDDTEEEEIIDYNDSAGINDNEIERTTIANDDENNDDYNEEDNFELDNSIDEDPEDNGMGQLDHSLSERK